MTTPQTRKKNRQRAARATRIMVGDDNLFRPKRKPSFEVKLTQNQIDLICEAIDIWQHDYQDMDTHGITKRALGMERILIKLKSLK